MSDFRHKKVRPVPASLVLDRSLELMPVESWEIANSVAGNVDYGEGSRLRFRLDSVLVMFVRTSRRLIYETRPIAYQR